MTTVDMKIRVPVELKAWLALRAEGEGLTMNGELLRILSKAQRDEPLSVYLHTNILPDRTYFSVSIGVGGKDLIETDDRAKALAFAHDKLKALGLTARQLVTMTNDFSSEAV